MIKINIFPWIFLCTLCWPEALWAQDLSGLKLPQASVEQAAATAELVFFIDEVRSPVPTQILDLSKKVSHVELSDEIIHYLAGTNRYQNITVKELVEKTTHKKYFLIEAHYLKKIQSLTFNGLSFAEQISSQRNLFLQTGKIFKSYLIKDDVKRIEKNLHANGYPNAQVTNFKVKRNTTSSVDLIYSVEKGEPCRIEQVVVENSSANILNFLNLPIETGSLCDVTHIRDKLFQIKNKYWQQGYLSAVAKIKNLEYSTSKERAKLVLSIEKGPKTKVQVRDENNNLLSFDFLNKSNNLTYSDLLLSSDNDLNATLTAHYQELGYPFVKVVGPMRVTDQNKDTLLKFNVKKGNFVKVGDIYFVGDLPASKTEVIQELKLDKGIFNSNIPFVQSQLEVYRDKLQNIFFRNGYADAQVSLPDFSFTQDNQQANLVFNSIAGDKYILGEVQIQNLPSQFPLNQKILSAILKLGDIVNFDNKQAYVNELTNQLLMHGYLYAQLKTQQVVTQSDVGIRTVAFIVKVDAGPVVKIGKVYAQGDLFNKEKTILSLSGLEEGEIFSQYRLDSARNRVLRHNLFSSVVVEPFDGNAISRKDASIDVVIRTRARTGYMFSLSPGWGSLRGYRFRIDYSLSKITEDGLRLISNATVSQEKQQASFASEDTKQILGQQFNLGFTEPLFKLGPVYTPLDMSALAGYQVVAETLTNREYQTLKLASEWNPSFFDYNWEFSTAFVHEKSTATSSENAVVQTIDSPSLVIREFLNTASLDTRNNIAWPTGGGLYEAQFGMARFGFGSNVQYNRYVFNTDSYFPLYGKLSGAIFAGGAFVSDTVNDTGQTVTPPASRRSTLTDNALIRGFPETFGSAAPGPLLWIRYKNNGVPNCNTELASVGGTGMVYLKGEARYKFNDLFGMVGFMDTGESYFTQQEVEQVKNLIDQQIDSMPEPLQHSKTQCVVDKAGLVAPQPLNIHNSDFVEEYWRQAYASVGLGLRVILGNYATLSLDYGYPIKDPSENQNGCVSPTNAMGATEAPTCISRIQDTDYAIWKWDLKFRGALHLGIGAKF